MLIEGILPVYQRFISQIVVREVFTLLTRKWRCGRERHYRVVWCVPGNAACQTL